MEFSSFSVAATVFLGVRQVEDHHGVAAGRVHDGFALRIGARLLVVADDHVGRGVG
jgi:hypothetical protein